MVVQTASGPVLWRVVALVGVRGVSPVEGAGVSGAEEVRVYEACGGETLSAVSVTCEANL